MSNSPLNNNSSNNLLTTNNNNYSPKHHQSSLNNPNSSQPFDKLEDLNYDQQNNNLLFGEEINNNNMSTILDQQQQQLNLPICVNCRQPILDPFILRLHPDLEFHIGCIKCSECGIPLDERSGSAFLRDGKIFCREDYNRLFIQHCQRCGIPCQRNDMVMRARQLIFHINCFTCIVCQKPLNTGETFLLRQNEIFCRPECFIQKEGGELFQQFPPPQQFINSIQIPPQQQQQTNNIFNNNDNKLFGNFENKGIKQNTITTTITSFIRPQSPTSSCNSPISYSNPEESITPSSTNASTPMANNGHFLNGQQQPQTSFLHLNNFDQTGISNSGSSAIAAAAAVFGVNSSRGTISNCSSSSGSLTVRQKHSIKRGKKEKPTQRIRTVLNESQLKLLKQSYNTNQRPDTSIKEQLVEQTGLNARVIRVWFQNKRCKDKKRQIEHREKQQNMEKIILIKNWRHREKNI
uniref:Uncharacterized protein n=1 Tax=Meloidogyne enterolobii TaxID=390850 RepID=A0A6V7U418_MELEN|nr:unnamed protein product [Meloidogyne enterolobii]